MSETPPPPPQPHRETAKERVKDRIKTSMLQKERRCLQSFRRWMRIAWPALIAELTATALLVWMGCATCVSYDADPCADPPVPDIIKPQPALSFGFMVMMNYIMFGHVSGAHMNPAVTLGAVICHQLNIHVAGPYLVSQLIGGMVGYGLLYTSVPVDKRNGVCLTMPGTNVPEANALLVEIVITFTLVLVMCNLWVGDPLDATGPIKVGLSVAGLTYAAAGATGASMNPVRSLAPALYQQNYTSLWVYMVGPVLGGVLAGVFARFVMRLPMPLVEPGLPPDA